MLNFEASKTCADTFICVDMPHKEAAMHYPAVAYLIIILVPADSRQLNLLGAKSCTVHCFTEHLQVWDNVWMLMHNAGCPLYPHLKATQESLQVCNDDGSRANFVYHASLQ